ncbi:MAG: hypothetical protein Q8Q39_04730 [bacterium]|nr:hypothetical protein [bacterium]MDP3963773.1 hypothetical protein [bacterium]
MLYKFTFILAAGLVICYPGFGLAQTGATLELEAQSVVAMEYGSGVVGKVFLLDGTQSVDDGVVKTFAWKQVSGPYRFTLDSGAKISVVPSVAGTYVFELIATDSAGQSSVAKKIQVTVAEKSDYIFQNNQTDLDFVNKPAATTSVGGTEDINIGIGEQEKKGNVEINWKVEEGEKASPAPSEGGVIIGESPDSEKKGNVEINWKVEEGEKLTPVFLEIDTIKGELSDTQAAGSGNDRLKNAVPEDGWPTGGVHVAAGDISGLTNEQKQDFLATVKTWAEVKSEQDLQNFALGVMMEKDQPAESLSLNYEKIRFTYIMPAKIFGLVPTSYKAEVEIGKGDNENWDFGRAKVKFSWYAFLLRKGTSVNDLTRAMQQDAEAESKKQGAPESIETESWSIGAARVMQRVSNVMKTKHDTVKNSIGNIR